MEDQNAKMKFIKARSQLCGQFPFFGSRAMHLTPVQIPGLKTMSTDGKVINYDPELVNELELPYLKFYIAHEAMHCTNHHHLRARGLDHALANRAGDLAINPILQKAGFHLPHDVLIDARFSKGESLETIYNELMKEQEQDGDPDPNQPGPIGDFEEPKNESGEELTESEVQEEKAHEQILTSQAMKQQEALCGKMPAGLERYIQDLIAPQIDWRNALWRFMNQTTKNDYSWKRPNRRFISQGLYLPSLYSEQLAKGGLFGDTSGSMGPKDLEIIASEFNAIMNQFPCDVLAIWCDYDIDVQEISSQDLPVKFRMTGGGGTSFRPPFEYVQKNQIDISWAVYITDGECGDYPPEPDYPVLWIGTRYKFEPPFGDVVYIHP